MKRSVLHVHSGNLYGGVETFLRTLARYRHLNASVEMSVAVCFEGRIAGELRAEGVPVSVLGDVRLRRPDTVWRARGAFASLLKAGHYDVVVCHQSWPHAIFGPVAKSAGIPLAFWLHMAQQPRQWLDRLAWRIEPDLVIANSQFTKSTLPRQRAPVEIVYYPVEMSFRAAQMRSQRFAQSPRVVIIQVSRMEALKGQRVLLEALARLRQDTTWTCWQIGGAQRPQEQEYLDELHRTCERLKIADRVQFLGQRSDVGSLLAEADIFCQPNLQPEAFGLTFIEALAAGLPVIGSDIGGTAEIVDERCGILTRAGDPEGLAEALRVLISDRTKRAKLGAAGPERARALCDPARQMMRIGSLLDRTARRESAA